jgi:hypothetical protein
MNGDILPTYFWIVAPPCIRTGAKTPIFSR